LQGAVFLCFSRRLRASRFTGGYSHQVPLGQYFKVPTMDSGNGFGFSQLLMEQVDTRCSIAPRVAP